MRPGLLLAAALIVSVAAPAAADTHDLGPAKVFVPDDWKVEVIDASDAPHSEGDLACIEARDRGKRVHVFVLMVSGSLRETLRADYTPRQLAPMRKVTVNGRRALRGVPRVKREPGERPVRDSLFVDFRTHTLLFFVSYKGTLPARLARQVDRILDAGPPLARVRARTPAIARGRSR